MVRRAPLRWTAYGAIVAAVACLVPSPAGGSTERHASRVRAKPGPVRVRSGPVAVLAGDCPVRSIEARVAIPRLVFTVTQPVSVRAVVHNVGTVACDYAGSSVGTQSIGPCGMISMEIENRSGAEVWPGNARFGCPMVVGGSIPPGGSVVAVGSWNQDQDTLAPRGRYRLIVGQKLVFSITLR